MTTTPAVLLIGAGRLARHLRHWNSLIEKPLALTSWDRSQSITQLHTALKTSTHVWLAISDSALIPFYEEHLAVTHSKSTLHFSGALNDSRLSCAHPLMSFPQELLSDDVYARIHFVVSPELQLPDVMPGFKNNFSRLSAENKSFYHALCVLAGNFPQLLWQQAAHEMKDLALPGEALDLYIQQITENYLQQKDQALTGPLVRKDFKTIEKNIESLTRNKKLQHIYKTFSEEFSK